MSKYLRVQSVYWLANHSKREVKSCMILKLDFEDAVSFDFKYSYSQSKAFETGERRATNTREQLESLTISANKTEACVGGAWK